jgi:hypothetical protein
MSVELRQPPEVAPHRIDTVVYAGQSPRRAAWLRHCFSPTPVIAISGGVEKDIEDVASIAGDKLDHVLKQPNLVNTGTGTNRGLVIFAADTRTKTLKLEQTTPVLTSQGKPTYEEQTREIFVQMADAANKTQLPPFYVVDAASGYHHLNGASARQMNRHACTIILEAKLVRYFATQNGFSEYQDRVRNFYSHHIYTAGEMKSPRITDLSAGLSLPVLMQSGAVYAIDDKIMVNTQGSIPKLQHALYHVAVGIAPEILSPFASEVQQRLSSWPWLAQLTENTLQST